MAWRWMDGMDTFSRACLEGFYRRQVNHGPEDLESVRAEVARGTRTWTAAQLADWGAERHGVRLSADRWRSHRHRAQMSWPRTSRTLKHKQDPDEVAERAAVLTDRAKRGMLV